MDNDLLTNNLTDVLFDSFNQDVITSLTYLNLNFASCVSSAITSLANAIIASFPVLSSPAVLNVCRCGERSPLVYSDEIIAEFFCCIHCADDHSMGDL